jgi:hypothetical protein
LEVSVFEKASLSSLDDGAGYDVRRARHEHFDSIPIEKLRKCYGMGATYTLTHLFMGGTFTIAQLLPFKGAQVAVKGLAL